MKGELLQQRFISICVSIQLSRAEYQKGVLQICDMIEKCESEVTNIDFDLNTKKGDKFFCFTLYKYVIQLFIFEKPEVCLQWGWNQTVAFEMVKQFILKSQN